MMKSVLISIRPQLVEKIAKGEKTIEVRKTAPKEVPFKAYIYCTIGNGVKGDYLVPSGIQCGKVIGECICDKVDEYHYDYCDGVDIDDDTILETAIDREDINIYAKGKTLYGWHISDLKIYDKPRELSEFSRPCSYSGLCFSCKRTSFKKDGNLLCNTKITRPPQSWMHVEDLGEEE